MQANLIIALVAGFWVMTYLNWLSSWGLDVSALAVAIFAMNRADGPVTALKSSTAEDALVTRPDVDVEVRLLPPGNATFLLSLINGEPLVIAASTALDENPSFDLSAGIAGMIEAGVFTSLELGD